MPDRLELLKRRMGSREYRAARDRFLDHLAPGTCRQLEDDHGTAGVRGGVERPGR